MWPCVSSTATGCSPCSRPRRRVQRRRPGRRPRTARRRRSHDIAVGAPRPGRESDDEHGWTCLLRRAGGTGRRGAPGRRARARQPSRQAITRRPRRPAGRARATRAAAPRASWIAPTPRPAISAKPPRAPAAARRTAARTGQRGRKLPRRRDNKRERDLARAHFEAQQARRAATAGERRRRQQVVGGAVALVVVIAGVVGFVAAGRSPSVDTAAPGATASEAPAASPSTTATAGCRKSAPSVTAKTETWKEAPPDNLTAGSTYRITLATNCGNVVIGSTPALVDGGAEDRQLPAVPGGQGILQRRQLLPAHDLQHLRAAVRQPEQRRAGGPGLHGPGREPAEGWRGPATTPRAPSRWPTPARTRTAASFVYKGHNSRARLHDVGQGGVRARRPDEGRRAREDRVAGPTEHRAEATGHHEGDDEPELGLLAG